jgi:SAM-dependent methyltransferase
MSLPACPVCDTPASQIYFEQRDALALCNRPAATRDEALAAPRADLRLAMCETCSHFYNTAFDAERVSYTAGYENSLHFSETFGRYARALAQDLVARLDLHGKQIVDIGCGDGAFLRLLCDLGGNRGIGFDPAAPPGDGDVELVAAPYPAAAHFGMHADLVSCCHVLEHLAAPLTFLDELRPLLQDPGTCYYFEVPNGVKTFCEGYVWDVLYEHCSYFTARSLQALFTRAGLNVSKLEAALEGQFLALYGRMAGPSSRTEVTDQPSDLYQHASAFARRRAEEIERWRSRLGDLERAGRAVAIWGAGTKGVNFLDAVDMHGAVAAVIDVNPRKQGTWIAGCGLQVSAPAALRLIRPHIVIVMNPVYLGEVRGALTGLGVTAEVVPVADVPP